MFSSIFAVAGLASFLFHRLPFAVWLSGVPTAFTLVEWTTEWILTRGLVFTCSSFVRCICQCVVSIFGALGVSALFWVALGSLVYLLVMPSLSRLFALMTAGVLFFFLSQQLGQHSWTSPTQESLSVRIVILAGENEKSRPSVIQKIRRAISLFFRTILIGVWLDPRWSSLSEVGKYVQKL